MRASITGALEFQEKIIMEEEWWSSVLKGGYMLVICTLSTRIFKQINKSGKGPRQSGGKNLDRSGAGEEGYAALWAGC